MNSLTDLFMEKKFLLIAITGMLAPLTSFAENITVGNSDTGTFIIGGNAELNLNYRDNEITGEGITENSNEVDQDGRLLVDFSGEKSLNNGYYVRFKGQPLLTTSGNLDLDDAFLEFGKQSKWLVRTGRFEAFDMFPKPQDVFIEYSGDTSNNLYQDNTAYSYQLAEARGRGADGQILVSTNHDDLYFEVNFLLGDRTSLFGSTTYHGKTIDNTKSKDTIVARPVISYQVNNVNLALAAETTLIPDSMIAVDTAAVPNEFDVSQRNGFAGRVTWAQDNLSINAMYAYLDALDEKNQTFGVTGMWKDVVSLGLLYSDNKYETTGFRVGDVTVATIYGSYAFRNVFHIEDFSILLGAYYSDLDDGDLKEGTLENSEGGDGGGRIRLYYEF